ncbi:hypothetical protein D3C85_1772430 [compost metagenome]
MSLASRHAYILSSGDTLDKLLSKCIAGCYFWHCGSCFICVGWEAEGGETYVVATVWMCGGCFGFWQLYGWKR